MNYKTELVIKKSTFISYLFVVNSKEQIKEIINNLKSEHKKARHICFGYLLIKNGIEQAGFDDDGEPKNTAGRPIYELLKIKKMSNILVVTIRYFGGIKLGSGLLIRTYRQSANLSIISFLSQKK
ncbi:YigZ family protein [Mycoplasmopsis cricetuli]|uniref:YigZ family protein n=1 Tax=Mycoplasmopsis cricetuli TaxID=171283 RepID=UPI0004703508|nr:YigZ family protein [Mycoplasmopsis cricetuli]